MKQAAQRRPLLLAIAILAFLSAIPLYKAILMGQAIGPFDQIRQMAPWSEPAPKSGWDVLQADGVLQFWFWRGLVLEGWATGDTPFWNPYQLAGTPLLANSQSGALYPPHVLFGLLHIPTKLAITLLAWLHLILAGLGVYFLALRLKAPQLGALVAGGAVCLSPFLLSWLPLASVPSTVAWIPWCVVMAMAVGDPELKRWGKPAAGLAFCAGMMILAGHLQFAFYGLMAAFLAGIITAVPRWPRVAGLVGAFAVGAMLAAPQLMPVMQFSKFSHRQGTATSEGYTAYASGGLAPFEAMGVAFPQVMGEPGGTIRIDASDIPSYWPMFARRGAAYAEGALAIGPLLFALFFLARRKDWTRERIAVAVVGGIGLLLAFGTPLNMLFYFGVPGWSATGSPSRAICLFVLLAAALAASFWPQPDSEDAPPTKRAAIALGVIFLITVIFAGAGTGGLRPWFEGLPDPSILAARQFMAAMPMVMATAILCGLAIYMLHTRKPRFAAASALAAALALGGWSLVPTASETFERQSPEPSLRRAFVNEPWSLFSAAPALMPPNTAGSQRMYDIAGYDSLLHRDTVALIKEIDGRDAAPEANGNIMYIKPGFDAQKLSEAGVSEVWSLKPIESLEASVVEDGIYKYPLPTQGRAFTENGAAEFVKDGLSRQTLKALGPGTLTIKDRHMPGWTATVNGSPAEITADGPWRQIELPDGEATVELRYEPPGLKTGLGLGALGLLLCGLMLSFGRRAEIKPSEPAEPFVQ